MNCKYKSSMTKKKAFTLIELLIVIAIIGILFIVLVSKVDFATDKAKASGVQTDFRSFQVAFETVSKENAGFNTFGWDTGDNGGGVVAGGSITINGKSYTYDNASKDAGDRIRNSYDEGDSNLNSKYDDGEVWTGRKVYTETWTGCYTLINPGNASDMSAIFDLQTAINKNLDPKLHINIDDDGTITMANGLKDPWSTQYHGQYITNASADAAAKWNTDASMAGSTGDNMDRGAILMYSNGANQKFGTMVKIEKGVVTTAVSQIDADHPDNNKMGADDYVLAVVYSYSNGYGETTAITEGFSNDQVFLTGNGGSVGNTVNGGNNGDTLVLPAENPSGDLQNYFDAGNWSSIKALAQANLSKDDYKNKYGIEPGDTIVSNGTKYVLVDLGCDDNGDGVRDNYAGFVFMYNTKAQQAINNEQNYNTGYLSSHIAQQLDEMYDDFANVDPTLHSAIKEVSIACGNSGTLTTTTQNKKVFLVSMKEMGFDVSEFQFAQAYHAEGVCFDLFTVDDSTRAEFAVIANISNLWWSRSMGYYGDTYYYIAKDGYKSYSRDNTSRFIVPAFVIG